MQSKEKIANCYNATADHYAAERSEELSQKHLDRLLLEAFASTNKDMGPCADFGCGPGQTTKFLFVHGITDITGIDLSHKMINAAKQLSPGIRFETGDLLGISYAPNHFGSALAFYAIVHFSYDQIRMAFSEVNRVLKKGGQFLCAFHVGDGTVHFDKAGEVDVDIDLFLFPVERITALLRETGFSIIDALERQPYDEVEWATQRAYIWAEKK